MEPTWEDGDDWPSSTSGLLGDRVWQTPGRKFPRWIIAVNPAESRSKQPAVWDPEATGHLQGAERQLPRSHSTAQHLVARLTREDLHFPR